MAKQHVGHVISIGGVDEAISYVTSRFHGGGYLQDADGRELVRIDYSPRTGRFQAAQPHTSRNAPLGRWTTQRDAILDGLTWLQGVADANAK